MKKRHEEIAPVPSCGGPSPFQGWSIYGYGYVLFKNINEKAAWGVEMAPVPSCGGSSPFQGWSISFLAGCRSDLPSPEFEKCFGCLIFSKPTSSYSSSMSSIYSCLAVWSNSEEQTTTLLKEVYRYLDALSTCMARLLYLYLHLYLYLYPYLYIYLYL